jgi:hypothetical protein
MPLIFALSIYIIVIGLEKYILNTSFRIRTNTIEPIAGNIKRQQIFQ